MIYSQAPEGAKDSSFKSNSVIFLNGIVPDFETGLLPCLPDVLTFFVCATILLVVLSLFTFLSSFKQPSAFRCGEYEYITTNIFCQANFLNFLFFSFFYFMGLELIRAKGLHPLPPGAKYGKHGTFGKIAGLSGQDR